MSEPRFCTNCRAELPRGADSCPACGVFAGDVFDGTWPPRPAHTRFWLTLLGLTLAVAVGAVCLAGRARRPAENAMPDLPPSRVVADRPGGSRRAPGATLSEAEAVRLLRRHIVATRRIENSCLAILGDRKSGDYAFVVHDSCAGVRLGRWRVDPRSGEAGPMR